MWWQVKSIRDEAKLQLQVREKVTVGKKCVSLEIVNESDSILFDIDSYIFNKLLSTFIFYLFYSI